MSVQRPHAVTSGTPHRVPRVVFAREVVIATAFAVALVVAPPPARSAVLAWHDGGTLHLSNDPAAAPADARRFESRPRRAPAATSDDAAPVAAPLPYVAPAPVAAVPAAPRVAAPAAAPPVVIAPTIVVRAPETTVSVVSGGGWSGGAPGFWGAGFLPTGFIGHEHPQVPLLRGRRLMPHSHFFARGRPGVFTPWGHFTSHGMLVSTVPGY